MNVFLEISRVRNVDLGLYVAANIVLIDPGAHSRHQLVSCPNACIYKTEWP